MSRTQSILLFAGLIIAMTLVLVACGGDENVPFALNDPAQVVCSEECAAHGQCGTLVDADGPAILANEAGPAVELHDRFFVEDTLVTIIEVSPRELISASGGAPLIGVATPFPHTFYRVASDSKTAWVSEWCVARP